MSGYTYCEDCGHRLAAPDRPRHKHAFAAFDSLCSRIRSLKAERDEIQETLTAVEHEVAQVYCHITDGRISKANTRASAVIAEADELEDERLRAALRERGIEP